MMDHKHINKRIIEDLDEFVSKMESKKREYEIRTIQLSELIESMKGMIVYLKEFSKEDKLFDEGDKDQNGKEN